MAYTLPTKTQIGLGNVPNLDTSNPANISQDGSHRFATDTEKTLWDASTASSAYMSYQAIISQSGTSAPSATDYVNQLGTTMTWARTTAGVYTLTAGSAVFTSGKTVILLSNPITGLVSYIVVPTSTTVITVSTFLLSVIATVLTAVATDALITNLLVEVRVYN